MSNLVREFPDFRYLVKSLETRIRQAFRFLPDEFLESGTTKEVITMLTTSKNKSSSLPTVMRRMRESAELTMRQVGAMIGVSHAAGYRIEQLVKARGHSHESDFADCFHIELKRCVMNEVSVLTSQVFKILGLIIAVGCLGTIYESVKRQRENAAIAFRKDQIFNSEWNRVLHRL